MPADEANSSWHPAFMPNAKDTSPNLHSSPAFAAATNSPTRADDTHMSAMTGLDAPEADAPTFPSPKPVNSESDAESASEEHSAAADQEPTSQQAPAEEPNATEPSPPVAAPKRSKHLPSDSFARTVAHEANWDLDDDDVEWSLPRTDTDPFKFLGPSDRTNSFPAVPPLQNSHHNHQQQQRPERLLPISQAEELMAEIDRETSPVKYATEGSGKDSMAQEVRGDDHATNNYVGGDMVSPDAEAPDARYEEGIPLISHKEAPGSDSLAAPNKTNDPFAEDDAGDDFFAQIGGSGDDAAQTNLRDKPLERKSTMQVLGSVDDAVSLSRVSTGLQGMPEEPAEDEDFWGQPASTEQASEEPGANTTLNSASPEKEGEPEENNADLAAKWAAAFGEEDDDDFILDDPAKEVDPAAFFGDDDDGFLDDAEEAQPDQQAASTTFAPPVATSQPHLNGRYTPMSTAPVVAPRPPSTTSQYLPPQNPYTAQTAAVLPSATPFATAAIPYGAPPPRPEPNKAASFADKSKGGYTSPYDLPVEVVKPRKRQSTQQKSPLIGAPQPPPPGPPGVRSASTPVSPPALGRIDQPASPAKQQKPQAGGEGFFADLPIASRARPASRSSLHGAPSPQIGPVGPPQMRSQISLQGQPPAHNIPPSVSQPHASQPSIPMSPPELQGGSDAFAPPGVPGGLVAPARVSPYAPLNSGSVSAPAMPPAPTGNRYSPASAPAPALSRYSPAPAGSRASSGSYAPSHVAVAPPILPHQPRTSSPLAHFEISHDRARPNSSAAVDGVRAGHHAVHEPRLSRMPSLPSTREVDEETIAQTAPPTSSQSRPGSQGVLAPPPRSGQTPPPPISPAKYQSTLSPPKRVSSYAPQAQSTLSPHGPDFVPPPRSHTQSPGALYGRSGPNSSDPIPRPLSVHDPTSPRSATSGTHPFMPLTPSSAAPAAPSSRPRGVSHSLNWVPPTDGREHDPLQRWKGSPIIHWGVSGNIVTSFPKDVPRYGINQTQPMILRSPGEVKIKSMKEILPLEERISKFPGPLRTKTKKKDVTAWLTAGIENLEQNMPAGSFGAQPAHEHKQIEERVLLWKILRLFIEHDGVLEGSPAVEKAVRDMLSPGFDSGPEQSAGYGFGQHGSIPDAFSTQMKSDAVDSAAVEQIRKSLLVGDREKAVWDAADKRLWGHALLIANTVSPDLYKKVSQEFVRKEVNYPGHNNESLAVLYEVLSGNHEECVDELVPVHARAGLQLMATSPGHGTLTDALAGLDKWRETLGLVLSNRSNNDVRAINSLGHLLAGYGRVEAAHICYIFGRSASIFSGFDNPETHFVLLGADHKRHPDQFAKDIDALLLSEVYEYGLSLSSGPSKDMHCPHLSAYKLQHAMVLAESGFPEKALQYCETLANAMTSQTRRPPYCHAVLGAAVDNLATRLRQAPKEESGSWISKPSMGKVSDSVWNRFNKFVAGDDGEASDSGAPGAAAATGPFARVAGGTPTISRPTSPPNATGMEMFGGGAPGLHAYAAPVAPLAAPPAATTRAGSRYAPGPPAPTGSMTSPYDQQQGHSTRAPSVGRSSGEYSHGSPEISRRSSEVQRSAYAPYQPTSVPSPALSRSGSGLAINNESSYAPKAHGETGYSPAESASGAQFGNKPYTPDYSANGSAYGATRGEEPGKTANAENESSYGGYQPPSFGYEPPPSYGYEPPSMMPNELGNADNSREKEDAAPASSGGYEPPTFQPYEPPAYESNPEFSQDEGEKGADSKEFKPSSFMDDAGSAASPSAPKQKSKEDIDRENAEMFRKAAEEDAKRAEAEKASKSKKGWLGGWFGGGGGNSAKKEPAAEQPKAVRAKLGEENSFYFDPELKRWVNKKAGADAASTPSATPPPPRAAPRSISGTPPPPGSSGMGPPGGRASAPPRGALSTSSSIPNLAAAASASQPSLLGTTPPMMQRTASNGSAAGLAPPSRPGTSMSNASSIDDLLSAAGPRKPGAKKARKSGRYVDVMAK